MHDKVMGQTQTGFTEAYAQSLSVDCDLDLWPGHMVLACDIVLSWWSFEPNYFQIPPCRTKLWAGHDSGTHKRKHTQTHTHTHRVSSLCPSAISWREHKNHQRWMGNHYPVICWHQKLNLVHKVDMQQKSPCTIKGPPGARQKLQLPGKSHKNSIECCVLPISSLS